MGEGKGWGFQMFMPTFAAALRKSQGIFVIIYII